MNMTTASTKDNKPVVNSFPPINRGTSITIPVIIKRLDETPFDLTDYKVYFTLKAVPFDHDYEDARAYIKREITFEETDGTTGRFDIVLSSQETWLDPGAYYFDIEIAKDGAIARLGQFETEIVGGVTNRDISLAPSSIVMSDAVFMTPSPNTTLTYITDLISDPPKDIIETVQAEPAYIMETLDKEDEPVRNIKFYNYAPRVSFPISITAGEDDQHYAFTFDQFFPFELPDVCPLKGGRFTIRNRTVTFELSREMTMQVSDMFVQHSPDITFNAQMVKTPSSVEYHVADNATVGQIHFRFTDGNDVIDIAGNYQMPDDQGSTSTWMLTVNWYNWVD